MGMNKPQPRSSSVVASFSSLVSLLDANDAVWRRALLASRSSSSSSFTSTSSSSRRSSLAANKRDRDRIVRTRIRANVVAWLDHHGYFCSTHWNALAPSSPPPISVTTADPTAPPTDAPAPEPGDSATAAVARSDGTPDSDSDSDSLEATQPVTLPSATTVATTSSAPPPPPLPPLPPPPTVQPRLPAFPVLRLLLPHLDRERVYSLREHSLAALLLSTDVFLTSCAPRAAATLRRWCPAAHSHSPAADRNTHAPSPPTAAASFPDALEAALRDYLPAPVPATADDRRISLATVDALLSELAALSPFSATETADTETRPLGHHHCPAQRRSQAAVVRHLFSGRERLPARGDAATAGAVAPSILTPREARWMAAIVLKCVGAAGAGGVAGGGDCGGGVRVHPSTVMSAVHPSLWRTFLYRADLRAACEAVETQALALPERCGGAAARGRKRRRDDGDDEDATDGGEAVTPRSATSSWFPSIALGVPVAPMSLQKGTSPAFVVSELRERWGQAECVAEVKYDGERMQVHVGLAGGEAGPPLAASSKPNERVGRVLGLFSKSRRNSTADRICAHPLLLEAVGLAPNDTPSRLVAGEDQLQLQTDGSSLIFVENAILDSELLAFDPSTGRTEGFYVVQQLSALNRRRQSWKAGRNGREADAPVPASSKLEYQVVFFDLLYLNGRSLIHLPLCERRSLLERVVRVRPPHITLSEQHRIPLVTALPSQPLDPSSPTAAAHEITQDPAVAALRSLFLAVTSRPAEGLVVKGCHSRYAPSVAGTGAAVAGFAAFQRFVPSPWIKLKKDYIDGFGDTAEFAVVAGRYDPALAGGAGGGAGASRVDDPSLLNVFVVGCQTNRDAPREKPHFVALFTFTSGFSRAELLQFSRATLPIRRPTSVQLRTCSLARHPPWQSPAAVISTGRWDACFDPPVAVELLGGGFQPVGGGGSSPFSSEMAKRSLRPSPSGLSADERRLAAVDARAAVALARRGRSGAKRQKLGSGSSSPATLAPLKQPPRAPRLLHVGSKIPAARAGRQQVALPRPPPGRAAVSKSDSGVVLEEGGPAAGEEAVLVDSDRGYDSESSTAVESLAAAASLERDAETQPIEVVDLTESPPRRANTLKLLPSRSAIFEYDGISEKQEPAKEVSVPRAVQLPTPPPRKATAPSAVGGGGESGAGGPGQDAELPVHVGWIPVAGSASFRRVPRSVWADAFYFVPGLHRASGPSRCRVEQVLFGELGVERPREKVLHTVDALLEIAITNKSFTVLVVLDDAGDKGSSEKQNSERMPLGLVDLWTRRIRLLLRER
ncbi:hypothetical protein DFJ73DRAFT_902105 [Zopfochytrium polystomum]|nr:hypothetical protein DFJ73DRAFT_902105 [Zopfochytrium polystomum]